MSGLSEQELAAIAERQATKILLAALALVLLGGAVGYLLGRR